MKNYVKIKFQFLDTNENISIKSDFEYNANNEMCRYAQGLSLFVCDNISNIFDVLMQKFDFLKNVLTFTLILQIDEQENVSFDIEDCENEELCKLLRGCVYLSHNKYVNEDD